MAEQTLIEWAHHTFAPWFGCSKVDLECDNCYAEHWTVDRFHKAGWGPHVPRVRSKPSTWKTPRTYQNKARKPARGGACSVPNFRTCLTIGSRLNGALSSGT